MSNKRAVKYAVIILNYNTAEDAVAAAESVIRCAGEAEFSVSLVDGGSSKAGEIERLNALQDERVRVYPLGVNRGFAFGNNEGVRRTLRDLDAEYLLFMNPDVIIPQSGTLDALISDVEADPLALGAQPLIRTSGDPRPPQMQTNIRRIGNYGDVVIRSFCVFRKLMQKRFLHAQYGEKMPFQGKIPFEVPSGAFFLIRTKEFVEAGMMSEKTFLYNEEEILACRLKPTGRHFVLDADYVVEHYQGKSTGSHHEGAMSAFSLKCMQESTAVYLREFLKCGELRVHLVTGLIRLDNWLFRIRK